MARRVLFTRADGSWAWRLVVDGNVVATSGSKGFESKDEAGTMADRVIGGEFTAADKVLADKDQDNGSGKAKANGKGK